MYERVIKKIPKFWKLGLYGFILKCLMIGFIGRHRLVKDFHSMRIEPTINIKCRCVRDGDEQNIFVDIFHVPSCSRRLYWNTCYIHNTSRTGRENLLMTF